MKKLVNYLVTLSIVLITLLNFGAITTSIKLSFEMCLNNLLPSIIPFLLISNILIKYNVLNNSVFSITLLCLISGSPSNSKYIKDYLDSKLIDEENASKLLSYLQYFNPLYILNIIGLFTLNSKKLGLIILISNIISSFILYKKVSINNKINLVNTSFINVIRNSIKDLINTLLYIIGIITTFFIITSYIDIVFNIDIKYKYLYGFIEITQGINYLKYSNLSTYFKVLISSIFISFGGLSMHAQIFGIINNKKIRYKPYLLSRIKHSVLSSIICSILFYILN